MTDLVRSATLALVVAGSLSAVSAQAQVAGPTSRGDGSAAGLRESDPAPPGRAGATAAAPGGEDGGAGGYGKVGNPYSQAGYGAGAFGNGLPSPVK